MYNNKQKTLMKKMKLFALGLIGASMMMTSCADDDEDPAVGPSLTVTEENSAAGVVDGKVNTSADSLYFKWDTRAGDAKLETFEISKDGGPSFNVITENGNDLDDNIKSSDNESYQDGVKFATSAGVYTFKVTDRDGETSSVDIEVTIDPGTTPLSAEQSFTWERMGGSAGTGLAQFGLKWTSNSSTSAIIAEDAATVFVELPASTWTSITTKEGLAAAITAATPITTYEGISVTQSGTYDVVLATMTGTDVYIMHVTEATVTTGGSGTDITIDGMYKM